MWTPLGKHQQCVVDIIRSVLSTIFDRIPNEEIVQNADTYLSAIQLLRFILLQNVCDIVIMLKYS